MKLDEYKVEPELQRAVPRSIKFRGSKWGELRPFLIFLVPHVWIAIIAPIVLVGFCVLNFWVAPFDGKVLSTETKVYSKGGPKLRIEFEFAPEGRTTHSYVSVPVAKPYTSIHEGDKITVYSNPLAPSYQPRLVASASDGVPFVLFGILWCSIWCLSVGAFVYGILTPPIRSKFLTRNGVAVAGVVTDVTTSRGQRGSTSCAAHYKFTAKVTDKQTGRIIVREFVNKMPLYSNRESEAKQMIGQPCTILYDPKNPNVNWLYKFSRYDALQSIGG